MLPGSRVGRSTRAFVGNATAARRGRAAATKATAHLIAERPHGATASAPRTAFFRGDDPQCEIQKSPCTSRRFVIIITSIFVPVSKCSNDPNHENAAVPSPDPQWEHTDSLSAGLRRGWEGATYCEEAVFTTLEALARAYCRYGGSILQRWTQPTEGLVPKGCSAVGAHTDGSGISPTCCKQPNRGKSIEGASVPRYGKEHFCPPNHTRNENRQQTESAHKVNLRDFVYLPPQPKLLSSVRSNSYIFTFAIRRAGPLK